MSFCPSAPYTIRSSFLPVNINVPELKDWQAVPSGWDGRRRDGLVSISGGFKRKNSVDANEQYLRLIRHTNPV